ncbi:hypothetical protein DERP_002911 [Dermatophagoides pteronyssinus]|uniref:LIM zinc-binding domain-containing protein n=1 Tax=Dermatophagoides pteronyssinus TaxID=6956 RepID=A0ABQ8JW27_DERPT|nr:hypothetical protein DERP_002911 [Dermatophagoides pteronyssinus]
MNIDSKCFSCDSFLIDSNDEQFIECLDQYYHVKCFVCNQCGHLLSSEESESIYQSMNIDEQIKAFICQKCQDSMINSEFKCEKCDQKITYHDEYFIQSDKNDKDKFIHMNCIQIKCIGCQEQILFQNDTKYWMLDNGLNYHLECLKCHFCQKPMDENFALKQCQASTVSGTFVFCCDECFKSETKKHGIVTPKNRPISTSTTSNGRKHPNSCCSLRISTNQTASPLTPKAIIANRQRQNLQTALRKVDQKKYLQMK